MLFLYNIKTGYTDQEIIKNLSFNIGNSECVALTGVNGSGKSTVVKVINGTLPVWAGDMIFLGHSIITDSIKKRLSKGISISPQNNRVFSNLSVFDNLCTGCLEENKIEMRLRVEESFVNFPILKPKFKLKAGLLSGGEKQILSVARALISRPKLVLLDEPTIGLSPDLVNDVVQIISRYKIEHQTSFLVVEHRLNKLLSIVDRVYIMKLGDIIHHGTPSDTSTIMHLSNFISSIHN